MIPLQHPQLRLPKRPLRDAIVCILATIAIVACAGCASHAPRGSNSRGAAPRASSSSSSTLDPCALRLHDLSGALLLYYASHLQIPPDLKSLALTDPDATVCPISHQPYVYDPRGLPAPDGKSRLIIYDSVPHASGRWAIAISEPRDGQPLIAEVIPLPESFFAPR